MTLRSKTQLSCVNGILSCLLKMVFGKPSLREVCRHEGTIPSAMETQRFTFVGRNDGYKEVFSSAMVIS
jgi:hypothetical protein